MTAYTYKGWEISHKGTSFTARKGAFFTGYHECGTTGAFIDILDKQYAKI